MALSQEESVQGLMALGLGIDAERARCKLEICITS